MPTSGLLHLADELVVLILQNVSSSSDLFSLTMVCRRLNSLAEPYLYASVLLQNARDSITFWNSLAHRPELALHVRTFDVDFRFREFYEPAPVILLLRRMENLQHLAINSNDEDDYAFDEGFNRALFRNPATNLLSSLRSCILRHTIFDGENWALLNKAAIFLHPTLLSLTIIGAEADAWAMTDLPGQAGSTSLKELHFQQCDIHAQSLANVLALPRALKCLTLGQHHGFPPLKYSSLDMNDYVLAMSSQYESLETLTMLRGTEFRHSPLRLESMSGLRYLEIDHRVLFTPLNTPSRIANAAAGIARILPSGIVELELLEVRESDVRSLFLMVNTVLEMKSENKIVPALERIVFRMADNVPIPDYIQRTAEAANVELASWQ